MNLSEIKARRYYDRLVRGREIFLGPAIIRLGDQVLDKKTTERLVELITQERENQKEQ